MVGAVEHDEPNPEFFSLRRDVGESETLARRGFEDHKHILTSCLVGVSKSHKKVMLTSDSGGLIHEVPEGIRNWATDDQCYALENNLVAFCLFYENSTETKTRKLSKYLAEETSRQDVIWVMLYALIIALIHTNEKDKERPKKKEIETETWRKWGRGR